jgi:hypothetical protein
VQRYTTVVVLWCVALGWAAAVARTHRQRLAVAAIAIGETVGFFDDGRREAIVIAGILLLLVDRAVPLPRATAVVVQAIAAASLWIYLTQWQVYPWLEDAGHPYAAVVAAILAGLLAKQVADRVSPRALGRRLRPSSRRTASSTSPGRAPAPRAAAG